MPTGRVVWFDDRSGEGSIRRDGHEYPVESADIEPVARVPRARVHFDIKRLRGADRAVKVALLVGKRVSPHQDHFGDLAGAHHPDEKGHHPLTDDRPGTDRSFEGHPVQLVEDWVGLAMRSDLPTLRLLYAPDAVLNVGAEHIEGRDAVISWLRQALHDPVSQTGKVRDRKGLVSVNLRVRGEPLAMSFRIAHGRVIEQCISPTRPTLTSRIISSSGASEPGR